MAPRILHLTRGGELLAVLRPDGRNVVPDLDAGFTIEGAYQITPLFETVRRLFEREVELLDAESEPECSEWAEIWEQLHGPGLFVESPDGRERFDILWIHFQHSRAWWWPLYNSPNTIRRRRG